MLNYCYSRLAKVFFILVFMFSAGAASAQFDFPDFPDPDPEPEPPVCSACDGKIDNIIFRHGGQILSYYEIQSRKGKRFVTLFAGYVQNGQQFTVSGASNYLDNKGTLGATIYIRENGGDPISLHTSCSQPIGPGTAVGSLTVVTATSRNGGLTCPVDGGVPPVSG